MHKTDISVIELQMNEWNDSVKKNQYIQSAHERYILMLPAGFDKTGNLAEELMRDDLLQKVGVVAFCGGDVEAILPLTGVLQFASVSVSVIAFDRELLKESGGFHEKLSALTNYEFLCRLTEANGSCMILPAAETNAVMTDKDIFSCTYLIRRHLQTLYNAGSLEKVVERFSEAAKRAGAFGTFQQYMNIFLSFEKEYIELAADTAPFAIIGGDDTCGGILRDFAYRLAKSLQDSGQAVLMLDDGFNDYERLRDNVFKGVVGFQSHALTIDFFRKIRGKKIQFWFDYPVNFEAEFMNLPEDYYILCQDGNYAELMKRYFHVKNALAFPPAGIDAGFRENDDRPYDIVFIGRYYPEQTLKLSALEDDYYQFMLQHPCMTIEAGLETVFNERNIQLNDREFLKCLQDLTPVWHNVMNHFRKKVIDIILAAGYDIHVYGETWEQFDTVYKDRLIIHPEISVEESLREWGMAKIGLNIMSWHKAGMTERIANIMLSGAVCLTDETKYIKEHFCNNEEVVIYQLDQLEKLPDMIREVLQNEKKREEIAGNGYQKALKEHTWECRTAQMLKLLKGGE